MKDRVLYRHNAMSINSIDTFLNIKGGLNNNLRDVYFIRGLGEPDGYLEKISEVDKKMGAEMGNGRLAYIRVKELPKLSDVGDSEFYSKAFDGWRAGEKLALKNLEFDKGFEQALEHAFADMAEKYKTAKKGVSESIARNFGIKVLYWLDHLSGELFKGWNERRCMKIIAENVVKEQEYMFYYFLTLLGCDVLLLENRKDVEAGEELKRLSGTVRLGAYGMSELGEYVPYVPQGQNGAGKEDRLNVGEPGMQTAVRKDAGDRSGQPGIKIVLPARERKRKGADTSSKAADGRRGVHVSPGNPFAENPASGRTAAAVPAMEALHNSNTAEKTFEELAKLASSIVMIAIHDKDGDILGTGSGIMVGREGFILTNNHVASGGRFYSVRIEDDEKIYPTDEVIKYNYNLDLAVIRIDRKLNPLPIYRGNKKLARGQKVVAIGSPLGLFNSVSDGIISGFRTMDGVDMIQFTAPISHGSSGGAVLNMQGEVIGISTAGMDDGQNINLAVSYESILMFAKGFL